MDKLQAFQKFWKGFDIPAYDSNSVPDDAELPYITYSMIYDSFGVTLSSTVSLWYRGTSWSAVTQKAFQVSDKITRGGFLVSYDEGVFWIRRGTPWAQRMSDPKDDSIRRILLSIEIEFFD